MVWNCFPVIDSEFRCLLTLVVSGMVLNGMLCTVAFEGKAQDVQENLFKISNIPLSLPSSCITADDLTVMQAKHHYEQMIPESPLAFDPLNDAEVVQQIEFFNQLENSTIYAFNDSKTRELMLVAFADAYGAYMYGYFVPVIKYSYYGGLVSYFASSEALRLLSKYQKLLGTNSRWKLQDLDPSHFFNQLKPTDDERLQREKPNCSHLSKVPPGTLCPAVEIDEDTHELLLISIPYYRNGTVHNPKSKNASRVLLTYYFSMVECFANKKQILASFRQEFAQWITNHLGYLLATDTILYPAFEGVLQIKKSIENERKLPKKSITASNEYLSDDVEGDDSNELFETGATADTQPEMSSLKKASIWLGCSLAVLLVVYIAFKMQQNRTIITNNRLTQRRRKSSERRGRSSKRRLSADVGEEDEMTVFERFETNTKSEGRDSSTAKAQRKFSIAQFMQRLHPRKWKSTAKGYRSIPAESRDVEADEGRLLSNQQRKLTDAEPQPGPSGISKSQRARSCSCVSCADRESYQGSDESSSPIRRTA